MEKELSFQFNPSRWEYKLLKRDVNSKWLTIYRPVWVIENEELVHFIGLRNEYNKKLNDKQIDQVVYDFHNYNITNRITERLEREYERIKMEKDVEEILLK